MARRPSLTGEVTQGENPNWEPLLRAVGRYVTCDFMWMFEVELSDGTALQAYKHIDTRCYVHLAADGSAFYSVSPKRYKPIPPADAFAAVFAGLPGLGGVTEEQVTLSWAAVDRLTQRYV
jgi:hypothetical protein